MTIDRASVEEGARLAAEATPGPRRVEHDSGPETTPHRVVAYRLGRWKDARRVVAECDGTIAGQCDATFIAHWNPEFAAEVADELQRLRRVEEAARAFLAARTKPRPS